MPISETYRAQVQLLVRTLPLVAQEDVFALKGGTAINLFVRDLPRLSVDIDLAYLPIQDRPTSLAEIKKALLRIAKRIEDTLNAKVTPAPSGTPQELTKLLISTKDGKIKIEVTPVLRGSVFPVVTMQIQPNVQDAYGFAEMQVLAFADLYGGKIAAALDRQHPRDLFDVRDLMANEGIDANLRAAFAIYLISHRRPMAEILAARPKDIKNEFERGFAGMTAEEVTLEELLDARTQIHKLIAGDMPNHHRELLLSVEACQPNWSLLTQDNLDPNAIAQLPAVQWRLTNINSLDAKHRAQNVETLKRVLEL